MQPTYKQALPDSSRSLRHRVDIPFVAFLCLLACGIGLWQAWGLTHFELPASLPATFPEARTLMGESVSEFLKKVSLDPHGKFFGLYFCSSLLPSLFFATACRFFFSNLRINAQRILALIGVLCYALFSYAAIGFSNNAWLPDPILAKLPIQNASFYLSLRALLVGITGLAAALTFALRSGSRSSQVARSLFLLASLALWLGLDWASSRDERNLPPQVVSPDAQHSLFIVVPDLAPDDLKVLLESPEMAGWKERQKLQAPVLPASDSSSAQVASLMTGLQPFEHAVRSDLASAFELQSVSSAIEKKSAQTLGHLWVAMPGDSHVVANLFVPKVGDHLCAADSHAIAKIAVIENRLLPYALLPDSLLFKFFPEFRCSQKFNPLAHQLRDDLRTLAGALTRFSKVTGLIWLSPNPRSGRHQVAKEEYAEPDSGWQDAPFFDAWNALSTLGPDAGAQNDFQNSSKGSTKIKLAILSKSLLTIEEHFKLLGIHDNTRFVLIGLSGTRAKLGVLSLFSSQESSAKVKELQDLHPLLGTAQLEGLFKGDIPSRARILYAESVRFPKSATEWPERSFALPLKDSIFLQDLNLDQGSLDQENPDQGKRVGIREGISQASLYHARRLVLCPFRNDEGSAPETLKFTVSQESATGIRTVNEGIVQGNTPLRPLAANRKSCVAEGVAALQHSIDSDGSFAFPMQLADRLELRVFPSLPSNMNLQGSQGRAP